MDLRRTSGYKVDMKVYHVANLPLHGLFVNNWANLIPAALGSCHTDKNIDGQFSVFVNKPIALRYARMLQLLIGLQKRKIACQSCCQCGISQIMKVFIVLRSRRHYCTAVHCVMNHSSISRLNCSWCCYCYEFYL